MKNFRTYLKHEFIERTRRNPSYSLRSFAKQLGINHATVSSLMSGKRKITLRTIERVAKQLNLSPSEVSQFLAQEPDSPIQSNYFVIQQEAFSAMSDWYFDAILELSNIKSVKLTPEIISQAIGITSLQAKLALETLERLELLVLDKNGNYKLQNLNSTNLLDANFTSVANRKYQKSLLNKSIDSIDTVHRDYRDHTSTTMSLNVEDLPKAKQIIEEFRHKLCALLQKKDREPDEVYQLQVSFFPLTQFYNQKEIE